MAESSPAYSKLEVSGLPVSLMHPCNKILIEVFVYCVSWFLLGEWDYQVYWQICGLFSILPAILEFIVLLKIFVFKTVPY